MLHDIWFWMEMTLVVVGVLVTVTAQIILPKMLS
jgi:hypothetical protein